MQKNLSNQADKKDNLEACLQQLTAAQDLSNQRSTICALAERLNIGVLDCAAALLFLKQNPQYRPAKPTAQIMPNGKPHNRSVRYRLDVGSDHQVDKAQIEAVLIQESGVDKKRIGRIDIRNTYTLVELPEGMPTDIFQILSEATIGERKLAIKRVKSNRKNNRA